MTTTKSKIQNISISTKSALVPSCTQPNNLTLPHASSRQILIWFFCHYRLDWSFLELQVYESI